MPAYLIARITVHDGAAFERYRALVSPIIDKHGGHYLVRGGAMEVVEGTAPPRLVVVEFPTMAAAQAFYHGPDYAPVLAMRLSCTTSEVVLAEGLSPI